MYDQYEQLDIAPGMSIDCIMMTLNAEPHLKETLDAFYRQVPIRRLLVIDGNSTDRTIEILNDYPRKHILIAPRMTTGKAFEKLKNLVETPWFIWIDVGKIPTEGWYDMMIQHIDDGDLLGSLRYNHDCRLSPRNQRTRHSRLDPIIADPSKRLLGGPWLIRTSSLRTYHVDDDYAQRNIDIIIRKAVEESGGRYHLVTSTYHTCYLPTPVTDKEILRQRHEQNAKGIVKYITPEYAREHATYLLDDHWMLMMNNLPREWIRKTNQVWIPVLKSWRWRRLLIAKLERFIYHKMLRK